MLTRACGHVANASPTRVCPHLVTVAEGDAPDLVALLTGQALAFDVVCTACDRSAEPPPLAEICEGCAGRLIEENQITAWRGRPGILERPEPLDATVTRWPLPPELGAVADLVPVHEATTSTWLALTADGRIAELAPDADRATVLASVAVAAETDVPRRRLHVSPCGRFAAVVHDYGRYGQVVDLARGGAPTMTLDGGSYRPDTVAFSAAFAVVSGRPLLVHRTAWNRLDVSDPRTGELLTARDPETTAEDSRYRDYFHGRLHVSPGSRAVADDGWVWAPAGIPQVWDLHAWLNGNVWESDDGSSRRALCQRWYHWDVGMCFIGDDTVAVSGIGDDDEAMLPGVRLFSVASGAQLTAFAGPAGTFLSDGARLYAVDDGATHVWDPVTGHRTATIAGFAPTCLHRGTGELAGIAGGTLLRWHPGTTARDDDAATEAGPDLDADPPADPDPPVRRDDDRLCA